MKCVHDHPGGRRVPRVRLYCEPGQAAAVVFTELGWEEGEPPLCESIGAMAGLYLVLAALEHGADPDRIGVAVERFERLGPQWPLVATYLRIDFERYDPRRGFRGPHFRFVSREDIESLIGQRLDAAAPVVVDPECDGR